MRNLLTLGGGILVIALLIFALLEFNLTEAQPLAPTMGHILIADSVLAQVTNPVVDVNLLIPTDPVNVNDTFTVLVSLNPDAFAAVDVFQWYVDFNPSELQCVPSTPTNDVEPGAPFASGRFPDVLQNSCDNVLGEISFAGGKGISGKSTVAPFVTAAFNLRATSPTTGTAVSFGVTPPRQTKVLIGFDDVTGNLNGATVVIIGVPPLSDLFKSIP